MLTANERESVFDSPTRVIHMSSFCIDHIFVRRSNRDFPSWKAIVNDLKIIDYCLIYSTLAGTSYKKKTFILHVIAVKKTIFLIATCFQS